MSDEKILTGAARTDLRITPGPPPTYLQSLFRTAGRSIRAMKPEGYYKAKPTPKAERERQPHRPVSAMVDAMATLGHAPRPRRRSR